MNWKEGLGRSHYSADLVGDIEGEEVTIAGWIEDIRPLGNLLFITLRDVKGLAQVVFKKGEMLETAFVEAASLPKQSFILVKGIARKSKSKVLSYEVRAETLSVLNKAVHPLPLDPTGRIPANLDVRLDARPLSLRNPKEAAVFRVKAGLMKAARRVLEEDGFIEVDTAKIIGSAAEGGAELFEVDYFERKAYLAQSPQLYKEQLTLSLDKVYEIGHYFRAERSHTPRHLNEFLSLDIEASLYDKFDVMKVLEKIIVESIKEVKGSNRKDFEVLGYEPEVPKAPFEIITYRKALEELGSKGPNPEFGEDLDTEDLRRLGEIHPGFFFIIDWPLKLKPFYIRPHYEDAHLSESFDLMYSWLELASGGQRIHEKGLLEERLRQAGLNVESFQYHLKVFDWGMPPHSGWGLGMDRWTMVVTNRKNIRDVVLYPRDDERLVP